MSDLDPFHSLHSFRAGVAAPAARVRASARAELLTALRGPTRGQQLPGPRRLGIASAAVAAAAAAAFVIAGLLDRGPGVVERAAAAVDPAGRVLHVVARVEAADGTVSVGESWVRPNGTGRSVVRSGAGPGDCLATPEELRCYDVEQNVVDVYRYDPAAVAAGRRYAELPGVRVDQPASIHLALTSGYARLLGESTVAGRAVHEIQLATPFIGPNGDATPRFDDETSPVLYVEKGTYLPVAERFPDAGSTTYYETYEFLPLDDGTQALLELPAKPGVRVVVHPVGEGPRG